MGEVRKLHAVPGQGTEVREDIQTADIPPRLAEDGDHIRSYSAVLHNQPVRETPAIDSNGRRFGTNVLPEALCMDLGNARAYLGTFYGFDVADSMLVRAMSSGQVVAGDKFKITDSQARTQGKMSVTTDKSRPGAFVVVLHILRQSGGKRKVAKEG